MRAGSGQRAAHSWSIALPVASADVARPRRRGHRMKRRQFITLLGGTVAWPPTARAQQPQMPVIGFLNNTSPEIRRVELAAFHRGLNEAGYFEGQNVRIEYRWGQGQYDRMLALARDLAQASVSVLVATGGEQVALAARPRPRRYRPSSSSPAIRSGWA